MIIVHSEKYLYQRATCIIIKYGQWKLQIYNKQ